GFVGFTATVNGSPDRLDYSANVKFTNVALYNEAFKQPLNVTGSAIIVTDQVKELTAKLTAKNFDLDVNGSVQSFAHPHFAFNVQSSNMDLDELLAASAKAADARKNQASASAPSGGGGGQSAAPPVVDYNAMFKPLRENPMV